MWQSQDLNRFLWALYNLGQKGKPYQPEYLHGDFGSDSLIAQEGIATLYDQILTTKNPRAEVFFGQWKIIFGEVCGYDVEDLSDKLKKLAEFYGVRDKPRPAQLLSAVHTYYAVLINLGYPLVIITAEKRSMGPFCVLGPTSKEQPFVANSPKSAT